MAKRIASRVIDALGAAAFIAALGLLWAVVQ